MSGRPNRSDFGLSSSPAPERTEDVGKSEARAGTFVHRIYRLVRLTELEEDAYSPGGPMSGQKPPKFKEVLVSERYFEGIG